MPPESTPLTAIRARSKIDEPRRVPILPIESDSPPLPQPAGRLLDVSYHFHDAFVVVDACRAAGYTFQQLPNTAALKFSKACTRITVSLDSGLVRAHGAASIALLAQLAEVTR